MSSTDDQMIAVYLARLDGAAAVVLPPERRAEVTDEISAHIAEARAVQPAAGDDQGASVGDILTRLGSPEQIVLAAAEQVSLTAIAFESVPAPGPGYLSQPGYLSPPASAGPAPYSSQPSYATQPAYGRSPGGSGPPYGDWPPATDQATTAGQPAAAGYPASGNPFLSRWRAVLRWRAARSYRAGSRPGLTGLEILAILLLLVGGLIAGIGWLAGLILLWTSPRWRVSDKLLGTLIWPGGLAAVLLVFTGGHALSVFRPQDACWSTSIVAARVPPCQLYPGPGGSVAVILTIILLVAFAAPILVTIRLVRQGQRWPGRLAEAA